MSDPSTTLTPDEMKAKANELIAYHGPISRQLTEERTSLESALIPVTAYIVVACVESWYRYPEMMRRIEEAMAAGDIGRAGRRPGSQVNTVYLWSIATFWLLGRTVMAMITTVTTMDTATMIMGTATTTSRMKARW